MELVLTHCSSTVKNVKFYFDFDNLGPLAEEDVTIYNPSVVIESLEFCIDDIFTPILTYVVHKFPKLKFYDFRDDWVMTDHLFAQKYFYFLSKLDAFNISRIQVNNQYYCDVLKIYWQTTIGSTNLRRSETVEIEYFKDDRPKIELELTKELGLQSKTKIVFYAPTDEAKHSNIIEICGKFISDLSIELLSDAYGSGSKNKSGVEISMQLISTHCEQLEKLSFKHACIHLSGHTNIITEKEQLKELSFVECNIDDAALRTLFENIRLINRLEFIKCRQQSPQMFLPISLPNTYKHRHINC